MTFGGKAILRSFAVPGGLLLAVATVTLNRQVVPVSAAAVDFYYAATFAAGLLLAWRFHSSRVLFTLVALFLGERAVVFFNHGAPAISGIAARNAFAAVCLLLPLAFLAFSFVAERGFTAPAIASRLLFILLLSVFVTVVSRPTQTSVLHLLDAAIVNRHWLAWTKVPQVALIAFVATAAILVVRFIQRRKPIESGFFWSLLAAFLALDSGGIGRVPSAYLATAALVLVVSVVETSYLMAYHDELTTLPARRAFNETIAGLENQYAIAIVDVDHFKRFNDTYGHETGDDVLRMVAAQLANVTGGGKTFRCGGEEFSIIFPGLSAKDAVEHLELLRETIAAAKFTVRSSLDRRSKPRGDERRQSPPRKKLNTPPARPAAEEVSVTVSMGVAEPGTRNRGVEQVIHAADRALYRAKAGGRNRVEIDGFRRRRAAVQSN